ALSPEQPQRFGYRAAWIICAGPSRVFRFGNAEKQHASDAELGKSMCFAKCEVCGEPGMAVERRDLVTFAAPADNKERSDQLSRVQPGLADQIAQLSTGPEAAGPFGPRCRHRRSRDQFTHLFQL